MSSPEKRAILHVGPPKTGSTRIQYSCLDNRDRLLAEGLLYPLDHWHPQFGSFAHPDPTAYAYNQMSGRTDLELIRREDAAFIEQLYRETTGNDFSVLVLSYEGFFALPEAAIRAMHAWLVSRGFSPEVLFYCRPPRSAALSNVSQAARMGRRTFLDQDPPAALPPVTPYADAVENYARVFGRDKLIARPFTRAALHEGDVFIDFLHAIGHRTALTAADAREGTSNAALSANAIRIAGALRRLTDDQLDAWNFTTWFDRFLDQVKGPPLRLTEEQEQGLEAVSRRHVAYLVREFGIDLDDLDTTQDSRQDDFRSATMEEIQRFAEQALILQRKALQELGSDGRYAQSLHEAYMQLAGQLNALTAL